MKKLALLLFLFSTLLTSAQNGINYKAVVNDNSGNVIANQTITVQFQILEGAAQTNVFQQTQTPTTDANGIIIVTIGANNNFDTIDWGSDDHFLNVQINTGAGLTDMGTTQFRTVPYALNAGNVTGLEAIDEGNGLGWRLKGQDPANYGNIGLNAVDLSISTSNSVDFGATGNYATAMGNYTKATGNYSTAMGYNTVASGDYATAMGNGNATGNSSTAMGSFTTASGVISTAMGYGTEASGNNATAMGTSTIASGNFALASGYFTTASGARSTALGSDTKASGAYSTAMGRFNIGGGDALNWIATDPLFEIGNGDDNINRTNALTVLKNGTITAPSFDLAEITDDKALITKEYADTNLTASGLETINEGGSNGWRLTGRDPANYGNIGNNAVDLSISNIVSTTNGAKGNNSFAVGINTEATGLYSSAMGYYSSATGTSSFAAGDVTEASGTRSTALGFVTKASGLAATALGDHTEASGLSSTAINSYTKASGAFATAMGEQTDAEASHSLALGRFNIGGGTASSWVGSDPLVEVGNGSADNLRSNALTILKNGTITAPSFDLSEITDAKALITKEYAEANLIGSGLEAIDEGNGIGYRLKGSDPANYGNIGVDAIDLSISNLASGTYGATNSESVALGSHTTSSGFASTAMGHYTTASGLQSTAMGDYTISSGQVSTAMGRNTQALAYYSTSMGKDTKAEALSNTTIGQYNIGGGNLTSWVETDPIFEVGNGDDDANRDNAITVLKNGKVGIGNNQPVGFLEVKAANSSGQPNLNLIHEGTTGARINFSNTDTTNGNVWTIYGDTNDTDANSYFNIFHPNAPSSGNILQLKGDGKVGIGTAPSYTFDVNGSNSGDYVAQIYNSSTNANADGLKIRLGRTTAPTSSNSFAAFFDGNNTVRGRIEGNGSGVTFNTTSDRRLKTNITNIDNALKLIDKIQPRRYEYKAKLGTQEYGFIAQELQPLYPQAVSGTPDSDVETNPMMVDYSRLTPLNTAGIKELAKKVSTLENENEKLKEQLSKYKNLEERLSALENSDKKDNEVVLVENK